MRIVTKQQATAGLAIPGTTSAADLAIKKNRAVRIVPAAIRKQERVRHVRAGIRWEATVRSANGKQSAVLKSDTPVSEIKRKNVMTAVAVAHKI